MPKHRSPAIAGAYYIPKETFLTVIHYCKQYPLWVAELEVEPDTGKAITYDAERVQTSNNFDPVSEMAMRRTELKKKKAAIEDVAGRVAGWLDKWILLGVCYDLPYYQLKHRGIPCGKDLYYKLRRKFYYEMAKRI